MWGVLEVVHDESIITDSTGISINTLIGAEILKSTSSDYQQTLIATPWHSMFISTQISMYRSNSYCIHIHNNYVRIGFYLSVESRD